MKLTIDIEEALIKENKDLAITPEELLLIREYETSTKLLENDALSRIGLNETLKTGKKIKDEINFKLEETKKFKQEQVFHISQIYALCHKYYLRFLDTSYYKGTIDKDLPTKITNFEATYGVKCWPSNTKICAPVESFKLQRKPKDPLLFYAINDEYYYLIHKWGNDLSILRRFYGLLSRGWFCWLLIPFMTTPLFLVSVDIGLSTFKITFVISTIIHFAYAAMTEEALRFLPRNECESNKI